MTRAPTPKAVTTDLRDVEPHELVGMEVPETVSFDDAFEDMAEIDDLVDAAGHHMGRDGRVLPGIS